MREKAIPKTGEKMEKDGKERDIRNPSEQIPCSRAYLICMNGKT